MTNISKSRLLATSAIAGLSMLQLAPAALAQDSFGIHNDQPEPLEITVAEDEVIVGGDIGVYADNGPVIVDNQGEIRGDGTMPGGPDSRPSGGVVIAQAGSSITNGGTISGGSNGIATSYFFSEDEDGENLPPQPLAAGTVVVNSGQIVGEGGAGVGLTGGGSVTNDGGVIQGYNNAITGTAGIGVAITEFPDAIASDATGVGSIVNDDGLIEGQTFGVVLQGGGTITNEGMIRSTGGFNPATPGITPIGIVMGATDAQQGRSATLDNDGVVLGFLGVLAGGSLETTTIDNDGIINGNAIGIIGQSTGDLVINNAEGAEIASGGNAIAANSSKLTVNNAGTIRSQSQNGINILTAGAVITNSGVINGQGADGVHAAGAADGTVIDNAEGSLITGAQSGVHVELGSVTLTNAGEIYGGGLYDGFDAPPDGGVTISGGASTITNSGTITGERFGITTASYYNPATGQLEGRATGTTVVNSGTIYGFSDDGVRLIGGGSVTNSGEIGGQIGAGADGVSMFAYPDQASEDYSALVTNEADGRIIGSRFGVVLSGGGDVVNDGTILGAAGGVYIQGTALNTDPGEERSGLTANIVNTGTIQGIGDFGGSHDNGFGVGFGSDMAAATLTNSGTITSDFSDAVGHNSFADLLVTNEDGGVIEGAISGIYGGGSGALTVDNAGTIRGNGTAATFTQFDAGISIGHADTIVTNSGTISGAAAGIATFAVFDEELGQNVIGATGTSIVNSGTITGESAAGVRLLGGGTVANSGTVKSLGGDGIQIVRGDVALDDFAAEVANEAGGTVTGTRYGIVAGGGGGSVANAGAIAGFAGGVLIQSGDEGEVTTASVLNSGSITSVQGFGVALQGALAEASLENSGSIAGTNSVIVNAASSTIVNAAGGTIAGTNIGVIGQSGVLSLTNAGTITGTNSIGIFSAGPTTLVNSGTISGMTASPEGERAAFVLGAFDDVVTLQTGSVINGAMVAGDGNDSLILDGDILDLTAAQQVGAAVGFEELTVAAGYWSTASYVGEFNHVAIAEGGALQVNEIEYDEGLFSTPIFTPAIANDGLLVVNFDESDVVSGLGQLSVTGTGAVQLIGEGVFTLDTDSFAHLGGTTVSNGGLILTGTLLGGVTTEGDGFFQLGAGGTEGNFAGDLVNNGRFIFNRSDDYDFLGGFSGNGTLDKMGDSVLTFMGDYAFEGVTNILGGAVRIGGTIDPATDFNLGEGGTLDITGKDQTIGGLAGAAGSNVEMGENNLTVAQAGDSQFGGTISGSGSFTKSGDGTLNLTGDSDYSGPTAVNGGKLAVNGSIVSDVTVNDGGTLGGNGTVGSTVVAAGGTIAPGNSIGRLTVNGDLAFAAGSTYEVEVNAAGQGDRLDATGAVTIAATAGVSVLAEDGDYNPRTDYVILTGVAGVTGTFGSVTTDLAFLDPLLRYGANSVTLSLYRNDIDFADVALGFNQASVAGAVQSLGIDNPLFEAVLVQNAATAQTSFGDLSGEIHANAISGLTDDSRHLRNALLGMRAPEASGAFVWGSAFGGWGKFDARPGGLAMDTDHKGLVAGIGYGGNGFAAALSAGIGGSDFKAKGRGDSADVESKYLAAHATYGAPEGGFRGTIGVTYAWHDVDTSRAVTVAPFAQTLTSKYDASTLQIFGEIGYDLTTGKALITPFARLAHVKTDSEAFTEAGGNAALVVADIDQKTTFLSLGARARFNAGETGFQPYLSAAWNRAFDDRGAIMVSRFAAGGTPFGIIGSPIPKNSAEVEAGFDYSAGAFNIGAAYTGTLASDRNSHGVRVTARIAF
ncbi:outer membrane autotransporter protein [Sphingopyxis panaciterrae]|uniref:autotransporter domain-containing protein n=1 Tax=Sphingopyxis panaciterrae TaxID=363841 RepID=UPI0014211E6C|nr:autotransporter domain-containing protein [Sphingopyxis panaciterrae]NIJ39697.1 outer membrane autotransporter protein [Sphingopyxis panaciterrae]